MSTVTQEKDYGHVPVLLHECLDALSIKPDGTQVHVNMDAGAIILYGENGEVLTACSSCPR